MEAIKAEEKAEEEVDAAAVKAAEAEVKAAVKAEKIILIKAQLRDGVYSISRIAEAFKVTELFIEKIEKQLDIG